MTSTKITKESIISSYHVLFWAVSQRVASESWEQIQHHRWMPGCKLQVAAEALSASPVDFASLQDVILFTSYRCLKRSLKHFKTTVSIVGTQNNHQLSSTSQLKIFDWLLNFWWNKSIIDIQVATKMAEFVIASPGGSDSIGWRHQQARDPGIHCANPGQQKGSKRIKIPGFTIHKKNRQISPIVQCFCVFFFGSLALSLRGELGISTGTEANLNGYLKNIENTVHWKLSEVTEVFYHDPQGEISAKDSKLMSRMPSSPGSGAYTNTFFEKKRKALFFWGPKMAQTYQQNRCSRNNFESS